MRLTQEQLSELKEILSRDTRVLDEKYLIDVQNIIDDLIKERQRSNLLETTLKIEEEKKHTFHRQATLLADTIEAILDQTSHDTFKKNPLYRVAKMLCANWESMDQKPKDLWR